MYSNIAIAHIKGGAKFSQIYGTVIFEEVINGIIVTAEISGLPQSSTRCQGRFFGFHIHER